MFCRPCGEVAAAAAAAASHRYRRSNGSSISRSAQAGRQVDTQVDRQQKWHGKVVSDRQRLCACRCFIGKREIAAVEACIQALRAWQM